MRHVSVDESLHDIVVSHLHYSWHTTKSVNILLGGEYWVLILHLTVAWHAQIFLRHIEAHQAVEIIGHSLREVDKLCVSLFVNHRNLIFNRYEQ